MRAASEMPRPPRRVARGGPSNRLRVLAIGLIVILFLLAMSLRGIATAYTDYLWFDTLGQAGVWTKILSAKILLGAVFVALFFLIMWINLYLADRLAPVFRPPGPEEQILARYHDVVGGRAGAVRFATSALFALSAGVGASTQWNNWIMFRNGGEFGIDDPQFGRDLGFYIFDLPFMTFVVDWLFTALFISLIVTVGAHYVNGGIRLQAPGEERVTPQVKGHLSVLLGLMALVKAADYWLARFELTVSRNGTVDGATFTDVSARLPVFNLLILIALFAALLFLANIRLKGWVLPAVAVGLWAIVSIIMQGIYPFAIQRLQVEPSEADREAIYIERNIAATRTAFGLDRIDLREFPYEEQLTGDDIVANADILRAVPLLDRAIVDNNYRFEQKELPFYKFPAQLDADRYKIGDEIVPVVIAARDLDLGGLPSPGWENEHMAYTHGNGVVIAPANEVDNQKPNFIVGDIPLNNVVADSIVIDQPRIYHGENLSGYAIVNGKDDEVDFLDESRSAVTNRYDGTGGVGIGSFTRQAAFALRYWSIDPLISDLVTEESRIIFNRDVEGRLRELAPFLSFDNDPYPVVAEGRIFFVVDAYTTSSRYPYSEHADLESLSSASGLARNHNYVRNSVKAVVDSYDGTVAFYRVDDEDPIIAAYEKAFPDLFTPAAEAPQQIRDHWRYPEDMFIVQTNMFGRYQISDAQQFYQEFGRWDVAQDPGGVKETNTTEVLAADGISIQSREQRVDPYYTQIRLPEETESDFVIMRSYVEVSDDSLKEMTAFVAGNGDWGEDDYGRLLVYRIPAGARVDAPALAASSIASQDDISKEISLLDVEGSVVELDDLLIVPIENSLLYIRPFYLTPTGTQDPQLERVIMVYGDNAVMCPSYGETFEVLFGVSLPGYESTGNANQRCEGDLSASVAPVTRPTTPTDAAGAAERADDLGLDESFDATNSAEVLARVELLLQAADQARLAGDLGSYQALVSDALGLLAEFEAAEADDADPESEPA